MKLYNNKNKKSTITNSKKNIFDSAEAAINSKDIGCSVIIPHVCNNADVFEPGFASIISKKYPVVKTNYHLLGKNFLTKNPGYVQFIDVDREPTYNRRLIVANMIAQNGVASKINSRPLNYAYLVKSMAQIKKFIMQNFNSENKVKIYAPKFGTKISGGNWEFISFLMEDIWSDIDIIIF